MGEILPKTCFSPQSEPLELYYAFLLVRSIFGEVHTEPLFLVKKVTTSEKSTEILRKFVSLYKFEMGKNHEENFDLFKQFFLIKPGKWGK